MRGTACSITPMDGRPLNILRFNEEAGLFGSMDRGCYNPTLTYIEEIGDGKFYRAGDPYPARWTHCPFTGERVT